MEQIMAFFNYERKRLATEDLAICYDCAREAGIEEHLFVNFGLLLGIVRDGDFIGNDDDIDMCLKADKITEEQERKYLELLEKKEMFMARRKSSTRKDTGRCTWFSLRKRPIHAKFCHWLGFEWEGFWWWSKAGKWVTARKFDMDRWGYTNDTDGLMLGIPAEYMEELIWINFRGIKVKIPARFGSILDWEYPGWVIPKKGGSSKKQTVCIIGKWADQRTWRVKMG